MTNLNDIEVACVAGGMLAGSTLLSRPVHTSLPAIVVLTATTYTPSPTYDPNLFGLDTED